MSKSVAPNGGMAEPIEPGRADKSGSGRRGRQPPTPESLERQKQAGNWLRQLREKRQLSQSDLARLLGARNKFHVSQIENGYEKVPSRGYVAWAYALGIPAQELAKELLRHYEPVTFGILFERTDAHGRTDG